MKKCISIIVLIIILSIVDVFIFGEMIDVGVRQFWIGIVIGGFSVIYIQAVYSNFIKS